MVYRLIRVFTAKYKKIREYSFLSMPDDPDVYQEKDPFH